MPRSNLYYEPLYKEGEESTENLTLMRKLDEQYTETPFYGVRRMTAWLRTQGYMVSEKRVTRLLRKMGLCAIYPGPSTSKAAARAAGHRIYPYLLRNVPIREVNQVWSTDITYVRMNRGFCYLVAIIDWFSRYVLSWEVATSLEASFCVEALEEALLVGSSKPQVFNSDQGGQFTSHEYTARLLAEDIRISMDGKGRALDNVFVEMERSAVLWRSVKQEEVYIREYQTTEEAVSSLGRYFDFYNHRRLHQSLDYKTPAQVYWSPEATINTINQAQRLPQRQDLEPANEIRFDSSISANFLP